MDASALAFHERPLWAKVYYVCLIFLSFWRMAMRRNGPTRGHCLLGVYDAYQRISCPEQHEDTASRRTAWQGTILA